MTINVQVSERVSSSVTEAIYDHLVHSPEKLAYGCISSRGELQSALTYRELINRSESVAAELLGLCEPGDRAVLLFHGGIEFIVSFLGCLIAGVIAVPAYPVRIPASSALPARNFERLLPILASARPKVALSTRPVVDRERELIASEPIFSTLKWIAVEEIPDQRLRSRPLVAGSDIAFLQYTSGSTSAPKGVMVTHDNLTSVFKDMDRSWTHDDSSVMITWAPVFHDMGLIHGILFPLYFGFPVYTLLAASVLQQPRRWLEAITRFRGTHSAAPNFMLELCVKRIPDAALGNLDLSTLRACLTGAEPVRHKTLLRFRETFAPCLLRPEAIQPGYGLAEFTLTVSCVEVGRRLRTVHLDASACEQGYVVPVEIPDEARTHSFVGCGWTHVDSDIRIVDPQTHCECRPDVIGEIWVRGHNLTKGYWENVEATRVTMGARLADGSGPYLRTGDLGFVLDGELYIADRLKDMVIIHGRNLYPHDIEATVEESLSQVRSGRCCAFSIDQEGNEALVVVAEVDRVHRNNLDAAEAFARLREAISLKHEATLYDAVFVRTGTFPLTSSGKVQRRQARKEYLEGRLQTVARMREPTIARATSTEMYEQKMAEVRARLIGYLAHKLRQSAEDLPTNQSFERMGLDSLGLMEMLGELEEFAGQSFDAAIVSEHPTIEQLSAHISRNQTLFQ